MKKGLKIVGIVLLVILALLFILPFAFQGKIKDIAVQEANKQLNAEIFMGDLSLSFFKNFPNASVTIENFGVVGKNEFKGDTLANVGKLLVVINIKSLFGDSYEINKVGLEDASLYAKVLEDGKANWDIMSSDTTQTEEVDTTAASPLKLSLESFVINNLNVVYNDMQSKMYASVKDLNLSMSGEFSQNDTLQVGSLANIEDLDLAIAKIVYTDRASAMGASMDDFSFKFSGSVSEAIAKLQTKLDIAKLSFYMSKIPYLSNAKVAADITLDADLNNNKFTFSENSVSLNAIKANFGGFVQLVDSTTTDMDIQLNTPSIDFKQILSLIPAIYAKDFESIKTEGKVSLSAMAKGRMQGEKLPSFDVKLKVADAMFKYPALPSAVNGINIDVEASNPGGVADLTVLNIPTFKFNMAGNPFGLHLLLKTPVSDPDFDFGANGTVDFNKLKEVIPMDSMEMKGVLKADLNAQGRLSYVEKEEYDKFAVNGNLNLSDMVLKLASLPYDVNVSTANLNFTTAYVDLTALQIALGKNDLSVKGKLENFIPYVMRDETIKGNLSVNSNYFDLNDFISGDTTQTAETTTDTTAMSVVEIPANIDFALNVNFKKLIYDNINLNDAVGKVTVKNQILDISQLSTNTMGGSLNMKGQYNTQNVSTPKVNMDFNVNNMVISEVFNAVETAKEFAPMLANAGGNFSMSMKFASDLGADMMPVFNTVAGAGVFKSKEVQIKDVKALNMIADKINYSSLKDPKIKNIDIKFEIKDGRLTTEPFKTSVAGAAMEVSGSSGLDQTLDYVAAISLPTSSSKIPMKANVKIGGTFSSPKIGLDTKATVDAVKDAVKEKVSAAVDKAAQAALDKALASQKKLMEQAETQAEKIRSEAKSVGDKLISDAQTKSDAMVKGAKNPIEKAAKKKAGEAIVKEAKKQADKLNAEADSKANDLVSSTQKSTDKVVNDAQAKVNASK